MILRKFIVAALALALTACNPFQNGDLAEEAVSVFHQRFNFALYAEIHSEADPRFRDDVPRSELMQMMIVLSRNLGQVVSSQQTALDFERDAGGAPDHANITMLTEFEFGQVEESFVFSLGTQVQLLGYGFEVMRYDEEARWESRGYAPPPALEQDTPKQ